MPDQDRQAKSTVCVRCGTTLVYTSVFVSVRGYGGSWHLLWRFCARCRQRVFRALERVCFEDRP